ncbi:type II toxin-antitoxin system HicB family antitoxin [Candidatus Micrarchaeota archaeon]|nr:type II toxin-antitoxin system HicB family antitoxin [Candidatus Micrarchaeota archaeon]MBU2476303.1 type II toxin-antitoxin system HicB family antitoxin [Candidatus Micrarchaeota archaeon]
MEKKVFTVVIERDEEGWLVADVPELQGCHTQAKSMDQLIERVKEVIELCLEDLEEEKEEIPKSSFVGIQRIEV